MIKLLKNVYIHYWVPFMGRIISIFIPLIEGKKPERKPTYDLTDKN